MATLWGDHVEQMDSSLAPIQMASTIYLALYPNTMGPSGHTSGSSSQQDCTLYSTLYRVRPHRQGGGQHHH